jgi:hypothetical protein
MRYDYLYAKHQRASSLPFQKSKRGFDDWVRSFRSVDQHPYDMSDIQLFEQQNNLKKKAALHESGTAKYSINKTEMQRNRDDQVQWQDDGGRTE